jgi:hypothetical protein
MVAGVNVALNGSVVKIHAWAIGEHALLLVHAGKVAPVVVAVVVFGRGRALKEPAQGRHGRSEEATNSFNRHEKREQEDRAPWGLGPRALASGSEKNAGTAARVTRFRKKSGRFCGATGFSPHARDCRSATKKARRRGRALGG